MSELSDAELERYARQIVLREVGGVGQRRLKAARVAVIGAGGVGSGAIPALAGAGIGSISIIDHDLVDISNLHRQPLFTEEDVGAAKAEKAAEFLRRFNRHVDAVPVPLKIEAANAADLLSGHDLVLDGSDNFATRLAVSDACVRLGVPLIAAAAVQLQGQVGLFRRAPCYRCFVGDAFDKDDCDTCAEQGVLAGLPATIGSSAATIAINSIVGMGGDNSGMLHLLDASRPMWRAVRIPADPECRACGRGPTS